MKSSRRASEPTTRPDHVSVTRRRRLHSPHRPQSLPSSKQRHSLQRTQTSRSPDGPPGQKQRLLILGTGFAAFNLIKRLRRSYDITVISPRNHFLFTPLLPSTTVGTIEFRSIIEPILTARRDVRFFDARAISLDPVRRQVICEGGISGERFAETFDLLVIAVGAVSNDFGVPGVKGHALFLRELNEARVLRQRIIQCFERAGLPGQSDEERRRLLHFVVCGGGPTGVEFAAELHDLLVEDLHRSYPSLMPYVQISLVEASQGILNTFDAKLRKAAEALFRRERIRVLKGSPVVRVNRNTVTLKNGTSLSYGLLLWSTGNGPTPLAVNLRFQKTRFHRLIVDDHFRIPGTDGIYAIGDCAAIQNSPLPETAQVAQQEGKYLARSLEDLARGVEPEPFQYRHLGMLAYVGGNRALADLQNFKGYGWVTWVFWRSVYLTRLVSVKNKILVLFDWAKAHIFGRDISRF